jgi:hypothetical protein
MTQAELNRALAKQLGETVSEIARRGFSFISMPAPHADKTSSADLKESAA